MLSTMITLLFVLIDHNTIPVELIRAMIFVGWTFVSMFLIYNLGEMITKQFEMFHAELTQCDWYHFPVEIQRMFLIFMANTQELTVIRGYGFIWNRSSFKKVSFLECPFSFEGIEIQCCF